MVRRDLAERVTRPSATPDAARRLYGLFIVLAAAGCGLACRDSRSSPAPDAAAAGAAPSLSSSSPASARAEPSTGRAGGQGARSSPRPGIECGEQRCAPGSICCISDLHGEDVRFECAASECYGTTHVRCDDSEDCTAGTVCCGGSTVGHTWCRPIRDCGEKLCVPGGSCNSDRLVCVPDDTAQFGGRCASIDSIRP